MRESRKITGLLRIVFTVMMSLALNYGFSTAVLAETQNEKPIKILDGEKLYAINCSRCHSERYPTERTDAQWKTIMMHMQVRANLPPEQVKKIVKYMKENN